ncbi:hypothetical protein ACTMTF_08025 [Nonomuraea sp. ZG12]|uniref:hypothetical protein n=1 Tax=Nonomuraea sp. ZG12 TaxID=3452207 RepID=UPI003F886CD9
MGAQVMGKVIGSATVSLDGFIADESDRVGPLFRWYDNGDIRFFGSYDGPPALLGDPEIVQGDRVTHLRYDVRL